MNKCGRVFSSFYNHKTVKKATALLAADYAEEIRCFYHDPLLIRL